jgi:hypothetical protein
VQTQDGLQASSNAGAIEKRIDLACSARSAPQLSPPPSNGKDIPKEVIIVRSYARLGFGHVPLQFCPAQGDLSGEPFNSYVVRRTPGWERTLLVTDADVERLTPLLSEITRHIPSIDDSSLIEHLRGGMEPIETLRLRHSGGIVVIINSLAERETYHRYAKTFTAILKILSAGCSEILSGRRAGTNYVAPGNTRGIPRSIQRVPRNPRGDPRNTYSGMVLLPEGVMSFDGMTLMGSKQVVAKLEPTSVTMPYENQNLNVRPRFRGRASCAVLANQHQYRPSSASPSSPLSPLLSCTSFVPRTYGE